MSALGNKKIMANNIKYYLIKNGVSQTEICQTLGISMSTFSDWIHARTYPRIDKIELMANYFGIEKSDLVEERDIRDTKKDKNKLSPDEQFIIDTARRDEALLKRLKYYAQKLAELNDLENS